MEFCTFDSPVCDFLEDPVNICIALINNKYSLNDLAGRFCGLTECKADIYL
jgi:hypothetical protein